jgi:hypothetical protein
MGNKSSKKDNMCEECEDTTCESKYDSDGYTLPTMVRNRNKFWMKDSVYHREEKDANGNVLPACVFIGGSRVWYYKGKNIAMVISLP